MLRLSVGRPGPLQKELMPCRLHHVLRRPSSACIAPLQVGAIRYSGKQAEMPWHQSGGFGHDIRMWRMR